MKVLSLFDGISCARVALERAGIPVDIYYASEIERVPMEISARNYPDIIQLGDVKNITGNFGSVDLLIGGSPCQDLSMAGKKAGLAGAKSSLFYEYARILKKTKPRFFILENVAFMPPEAKKEMSRVLGVEPIMIDAGLVSAQQRRRLFWTNIPGVTQPTDRCIFLKHIVEKKPFETYDLSRHKGANSIEKIRRNLRTLDQKAKALTLESRATSAGGTLVEFRDGKKRVLTPIECERLQGLPDNYTSQGKGAKITFVSDTQRYAACGNAFNVDVIAHILSFIPAKYQK